METTTKGGSKMIRRSFNLELIEGLIKCRHKYPDTRDWLRQCIELERKRRNPWIGFGR